MSFRPLSVFTDTILSGASTSSGSDLGSEGWTRISVQISTMSTAAAISMQNSTDGGTTWFNVFHNSIQSTTVATPQFFIASGVGTNGGTTPLPVGPFSRVRFLATAVVSGGVGFKIICGT